MTKKDIHVVPHNDGWATRKEGAKRVGVVTDTQKGAMLQPKSRKDGREGPLPWGRRSATHRATKQRDEEQDQEDDEEDLGDPGRGAGDTAEAQNSGDDGDDEESDSPTEHGVSPLLQAPRKALRVTI